MSAIRLSSLILAFILVLTLSTSFSKPLIPGLLSDDFGIVTPEDVARDAKWVRLPKVTDPDQIAIPTTFPFWRCVRPEKVEMNCVDQETEEPAGNPIFAPELTLFDGINEYQLYTRRPWGDDACRETLRGWQNVLANAPVVCFSATIDSIENSPESEAAPSRKHPVISGLINRLKSRNHSWSYFLEE
jgi:hypothetical protein